MKNTQNYLRYVIKVKQKIVYSSITKDITKAKNKLKDYKDGRLYLVVNLFNREFLLELDAVNDVTKHLVDKELANEWLKNCK